MKDSQNQIIYVGKAKHFTEEYDNIVILESLNTNKYKLLFIKGTHILYNQKIHLSLSDLNIAAQNIRNNILLYFQDDFPDAKRKSAKMRWTSLRSFITI